MEYFYATVSGEPGEAYELLTNLAQLGVNFLALTSVPVGPRSLQLTLFPEDPQKLQSVAQGSGLHLNGPHPALLVQGTDEVGALARIHHRLHDAGIDVYASSGVTDGQGHFGYLIYMKPKDADRAAKVLTQAA